MGIQAGNAGETGARGSDGSEGPPAIGKTTKPRGFAAMDPEKVRELAVMGGKAAHASGTAHTFSSDEAKAAGRKGGLAVAANRRHMAEIGRRGSQASADARRKKREDDEREVAETAESGE